METIWQDLRCAARMLAKSPGFTTVAVLTLALGISANTPIFSVVDAVLLRHLPVDAPERVVAIHNQLRKVNLPRTEISALQFLDYAARTDMLDSAAAITLRNYHLTGRGMRTTASLFPLLGVRPLAGRVFTAAADTYGGPPVVLLSQKASQHEIAVRMALRARPGGALRLVLSQALGMAVAGVATRLITAFFATRLLANQLYGVEPVDPRTFMVVPGLLTAAVLAASSMPAWRATRVDPLVASRYE